MALALIGVVLFWAVRSIFSSGASGSRDVGSNVFNYSSAPSSDRIALVKIQGVIWDGADTIRQIDRWSEDESVKGIILRIVSPGGLVAPSQEIFDAVTRARAKKPVVCSMGYVAASGGYYIAAPCSLIIANPGTVTGSIGVIMVFQTYYGFFDKIGLGAETIKSGAYKDVGSPTRPFTEADRAFAQGIVDQFFTQFVDAVAAGRSISAEKARELAAGGRIYTGVQAKEIGLVDELGDYHRAVKEAARLARIEGEPNILVDDRRKSFWERLFDSEDDFEVRWLRRLTMPSGAYYIWGAAL